MPKRKIDMINLSLRKIRSTTSQLETTVNGSRWQLAMHSPLSLPEQSWNMMRWGQRGREEPDQGEEEHPGARPGRPCKGSEISFFLIAVENRWNFKQKSDMTWSIFFKRLFCLLCGEWVLGTKDLKWGVEGLSKMADYSGVCVGCFA